MFNSRNRRNILPGQPISTSSSLNRGLILWVPLTEGSGRQISDRAFSDPSRRVTAFTNALFSGVGGHGIKLTAASSTFLDTNQAALFDFPNTKWSVSCWFRSLTAGTNYYFFGKIGAGNAGGWGVNIQTTNDIQVVFKQDGVTSNAYLRNSSSTTLADGKWHHLAVNMTSSATAGNVTATIYVDGKVDQGAETQTSGTSCTASAVNLRLGARESGNYYDGFIADCRVWNRHLSLPEVAMLSTSANIGHHKTPSWLYVAAVAAGATRSRGYVFG